MFVRPYVDHGEEHAQVECIPPREKGGTTRILVPDSDNDDSLGPPISQESPSSAGAPAARAFSKRAARCAAALLRRHGAASSPVQKQKCMQQLGRLGGPYRSLSRGQHFAIWLRCGDLNARVIRETEAFFEGRMAERIAHPHITRANGALNAAPKAAFDVRSQRRSPEAPLGCRAPLPSCASPTPAVPLTSHRSGPVDADATPPQAGYSLSRGEQCALSLLLMEDTGGAPSYTSSPLPTYAAHGTSGSGHRDMGLSESLCDSLSHGICLPEIRATVPFWVYGDDIESVHSSPSPAAHQSESSSAAQRHAKRSRSDTNESGTQHLKGRRGEGCTARELIFHDLSTPSSPPKTAPGAEQTATRCGASMRASLSATVIELQNQRLQWDVLRQQSLFTLR
ncbi:hypothetical protein LSCM1_08030 [Leishmania martiniquensis]|uniref:Uncharacterized protein n=1 Tax=Leishmania martiniquensis TaxID=1580590 RepID=A0A836H8H5_9TRYP|nr:hypothetical protein LSCM1_08030 [Leishmania martiniquensis]